MLSAIEYLEELQKATLVDQYGANYMDRILGEYEFLKSKTQRRFHKAREKSIISGILEIQRKLQQIVTPKKILKNNFTELCDFNELRRLVSKRRYSRLESPFFMEAIESARLKVEKYYKELLCEHEDIKLKPDRDLFSIYDKVITGSL